MCPAIKMKETWMFGFKREQGFSFMVFSEIVEKFGVKVFLF
jgi:hypothetical protein